MKLEKINIAVIGQGYVGLPLAIEFGKKYPTIGFDINQARIHELKKGIDYTNEATQKQLRSADQLIFSSNINDIKGCNVYIVTVPTPIDEFKTPDLNPLRGASKMLGEILKKGDVILVSAMEHHSNIVPWQMLCDKTSAILKVIPMTEDGELNMNEFYSLLKLKPKLVFVNHISNALGTINPIKQIIDESHKVDAAVLIDGAQACPHIKSDLQNLDVDFYVTSAHKMCGPTGVGILYGKEFWLNKLSPFEGGGEMISDVTFEKTTYADLPHKFEAGTPNICGGIAFGEAINYMNAIGFDKISLHENKLLEYATEKLLSIDGLKIYGTSKNKTSVISFNIDGIHAYDLGTIIDKLGIAIRTGQHCAQPIMDFYGISGTARASFAFYNTFDEIDQFIVAIKKAITMLS